MLGFFCMAFNSFLLAVGDMMAKICMKYTTSLEVIFIRSLMKLLFGYVGCLCFGQHPLGNVGTRRAIFLRALLGGLTMVLFLSSLSKLPLFITNVIFSISPLLTPVLARIILKEELLIFEVCAVIVSLCGVMVISESRISQHDNPSVAVELLPILFGIVGALGSSAACILVRKVGTKVHQIVYVFNIGVVSTIFCSVVIAFRGFVMPRGDMWYLFLSQGLCSSLAASFWTLGLQLAPATPTMVVSLSAALYTFLIDVYFFNEVPTVLGMYGSMLIIASTIGIVSQRWWRD
ncbi:uncharacterized protein VTP21DRAFT_1517 [Calcarisporiella thermophila]|uniref:uncharacterized protein n=1 Tax=Calcarisporiella thermophila TaxID=911321 RepID=UPI00374244D7